MTRPQLDAWIAAAKMVDSIDDYDKWENHWQTRIYQRDGQLYSVEYLFDEPVEMTRPTGHIIKNAYEIKAVKRTVKMVEQVTYEPI